MLYFFAQHMGQEGEETNGLRLRSRFRFCMSSENGCLTLLVSSSWLCGMADTQCMWLGWPTALRFLIWWVTGWIGHFLFTLSDTLRTYTYVCASSILHAIVFKHSVSAHSTMLLYIYICVLVLLYRCPQCWLSCQRIFLWVALHLRTGWTTPKTTGTGLVKDMLMKVKEKVLIKKKRDVIYKVPCQDCDMQYIGETKRTMKKRLTEHRYAVRK